MNTKVIISLASNCDQEQNLHQARLRLAESGKLDSLQFTEAIWTEPYSPAGSSCRGSTNRGSMYLNQLLFAKTTLTVEELIQSLKEMEISLGRNADDRSKGIVRIDLDLMKYGRTRHHLKDWDRPYIKALMTAEDTKKLK